MKIFCKNKRVKVSGAYIQYDSNACLFFYCSAYSHIGPSKRDISSLSPYEGRQLVGWQVGCLFHSCHFLSVQKFKHMSQCGEELVRERSLLNNHFYFPQKIIISFFLFLVCHVCDQVKACRQYVQLCRVLLQEFFTLGFKIFDVLRFQINYSKGEITLGPLFTRRVSHTPLDPKQLHISFFEKSNVIMLHQIYTIFVMMHNRYYYVNSEIYFYNKHIRIRRYIC